MYPLVTRVPDAAIGAFRSSVVCDRGGPLSGVREALHATMARRSREDRATVLPPERSQAAAADLR